MIITEDTVRQALRLDDAESIDCLPNEEIFTEFERMGLVRNVDRSSKFYMYPRFLQLMIDAQVGDLSSHNTKYTSSALTQKVFSNMQRVGKGFSGVDTLLFEGMLVPRQVNDGVADDVADVAPTLPPSPIAQPSSPSQQQQPSQPSQTTEISIDLLNTLLETCTTLTRKVESLEQDKIAQALEIIKLKQRVRRLERRESGKIAELDADEDVTLEEVAAEDGEAEPAELKEVIKVVTTAKFMTEVVTAAATTITAIPSAARRRKGVVIRDPEETATPLIIVHSESKSKDKGKGILVKEPKPLKKQAHIEQDEAYARELKVELNANINWNEVIEQVKRKEKLDNTVMRYQALKRKPQTKAQARRNTMVYLKNMAGFKMDFFKGMTYDDIRPIFEKHFNFIVAFLEKGEEQLEEKASKAIKRKSESSEEKAAKKQKLDEEVEELKTHIHIVLNDEDDVYTEATPLALKLFLSFISLLRNFNREDLEMLWKIVQARFALLEPKNFSDDFLLNTLKAMFKKPNVEAHIWKNQRGSYGLAKFKSWKLLESCGVHIIRFTTTQMILLVERRYPLTRFTLDQMLNNVRLEVKEESEVSLELLRFVRRQQQEGYRLE
nr:hypothetical protein [Tanacetum cinerariifolium]